MDEKPRGEQVDQWVRSAQQGDPAAFEQLVHEFARPMFNLAYRMVGNADDAAELSQDIFVKLHRSIRRFRWQSKFSTWLFAVASNTCRSGVRRLARRSRLEVYSLDTGSMGDGDAVPREAPDTGDGPDTLLLRTELQRDVQAAILELPARFREAVVLRDIQGLSYEEMAAVMKCSMGTVKSRVARGRLRLRDVLVRRGVVCDAKP